MQDRTTPKTPAEPQAIMLVGEQGDDVIVLLERSRLRLDEAVLLAEQLLNAIARVKQHRRIHRPGA